MASAFIFSVFFLLFLLIFFSVVGIKPSIHSCLCAVLSSEVSANLSDKIHSINIMILAAIDSLFLSKPASASTEGFGTSFSVSFRHLSS